MTAPAVVREDRRLVAGPVVLRLVLAVAVYSLLAVGYERLSRHGDRPPFLDVLLATVAVGAVLWVVHDPLDRAWRRVVLGQRAEGHEVMRELLQRMSTTLAVDEVVPRVAEAASRMTGTPWAEVRLWLAEGERWSQAWPAADDGVHGERHTVGVRHAGAEVGEITVELGAEQLSPVDRVLLDDLARPAGLALSTVSLTIQLRQRKAELERLTEALEASRNRLLSARSDEQRRLRHEVAARVSSHVSTARALLRAPEPAQAAGGVVDAAAVEQAGTEAGRALEELRSIARGVYPPRLADQGYGASVDGWLLETGLHAGLRLPRDLAQLHTEPALEACLYFCTVTVLRSLADGGATGLEVILDEGADRVELTVTGRGGRPVDDDTRLVVTDRMEAFDGRVRSVPGVDLVGISGSVPRPQPPGPNSSDLAGAAR